MVVFDERLGVDDVFNVRIVGEPGSSGQYRVGADGTIDFPYVGRWRCWACARARCSRS